MGTNDLASPELQLYHHVTRMFQPTTDLQLTQPSPSRLRLANKMQELELEETTAKSDLDIMPASDIIDALQNILEQSRLMVRLF